MASVMVHELEEAATDPIGNGWYTPVAGQREENADKCAWTFGTTYAAANGATANIALGGHDYLIQQNWVNAASGGYCSLTSALPFYAGNARIFAGSGDWQFGSYKAECDRNAAATGLSKYPDAVSGHSLLCQSNDTGAFPHAVCHNVDFSAGDRRGTVDTGDWDTGFNKGECAGDEYVAGVSQFTNGPLHSILCCKGRVAHNACGALTFAAGDAGEPSLSSNWDNGFNKAECGPGRYMAGVSRDRQSGAGNSILCCSP
jgi:hypothetical protein